MKELTDTDHGNAIGQNMALGNDKLSVILAFLVIDVESPGSHDAASVIYHNRTKFDGCVV